MFFLTLGWLQDDEIDEVENIVSAAQCLKENGARKIYAVATHALLSGNAPLKLQESVIDEVTLLSSNDVFSPIFWIRALLTNLILTPLCVFVYIVMF